MNEQNSPSSLLSPSGPSSSSSPVQRLPNVNIDMLLLQEQNNDDASQAESGDNADYDDDENNSQGANTAISSLPPFISPTHGEGGLRRQGSEFSSIGSLGNILDSNLFIDEDLECGPVPEYLNENDQQGLIIMSGNGSTNNHNHNNKPNEVYINTAPTNSPATPGKLGAYMGMSRRGHKSSDVSISGSSIGSKNSLSSIFELISKRNLQPHHSRGLKKKREWCAPLRRFFIGNSEPRRTNFDNEKDEHLHHQREERMVKIRFLILLSFLVCILLSILHLSFVDDEKKSRAKGGGVVMNNGDDPNILTTRNGNHEYNPHDIPLKLIEGGVPIREEGPAAYGDTDHDTISSISSNSNSISSINNMSGSSSSNIRGKRMNNKRRKKGREGGMTLLPLDKLYPKYGQYLSGVTTIDKNHIDTPLFWNIPESGSEVIIETMSTCLSYNVAGGSGEFIFHDASNDIHNHNANHGNNKNTNNNSNNKNNILDSSSPLQIVKLDNNHNKLNVDLSNPIGIAKAKEMNLVPSKMADIIITPMFLDSLTLFNDKNKGRAYTFMRHPVDRAIRTYHTLQSSSSASSNSNTNINTSNEQNNNISNNNMNPASNINHDDMKSMTLDAYARSTSLIENNWMVRTLSGRIEGEVTGDHLKIAKDILEKKFVIGLYERSYDSLNRFEQYFGIMYGADDSNKVGGVGGGTRTSPSSQQHQGGSTSTRSRIDCRNSILNSMNNNNSVGDTDTTKIHKGTISLLEWQNKYDLELYNYAVWLYNIQGEQMFPNLKEREQLKQQQQLYQNNKEVIQVSGGVASPSTRTRTRRV